MFGRCSTRARVMWLLLLASRLDRDDDLRAEALAAAIRTVRTLPRSDRERRARA